MEPVLEPETRELVQACAAGDRSAQRALYDRFVRRVHFLASRMVGPNDADDVVQNVFLQVFRRLDQFRQESRFETWLYRLAVNEALQHRRRNHRWPMPTLVEEQAPPSTEPRTGLDERELLERALEALPDDLRLLFVLREVDDLSYRELAEVAGIPEGTIASRLHRARQELRDKLTSLGWEERT